MRRRYENQQQSSDFHISDHSPRFKKNESNHAFSRQSTTTTRIQQKLNSSPLKVPLSKAISRVTQKDPSIQKSSSSRYLGRSSRRDDSSIISLTKKIYYDEDSETMSMKGHPQTIDFIKKNFGDINKEITFDSFIEAMLKEYEYLWGTKNVDKIFDDFTFKVADIFGSEYIDLRELSRITRQDGMIGLILRIFQEVKQQQKITKKSNYTQFSQNPQVQSINKSFQDRLTENQSINGLKNVVQEFMEGMYQVMETQIYSKYNVEMKRMVLKYRQAQKLLKKTNQKITAYADVLDFDRKIKQKQKEYENKVRELNQLKEKAISDLQKEKQLRAIEQKERDMLFQDNSKLKENLQKYQNALLNRAIDNQETTSRKCVQSRISERPSLNQNLRNSHISSTPQEPIKITIDTHIVHKENQLPQSKAYSTYSNIPPLSPHRTFYDKPVISTSHINPSQQFNTSRVSSTSFRTSSPYSRVHHPM